ncbi:hypothetical protein CEXT_794091 [Caerostris extrusa]|uniref:Uncharacterized protein n=1 Tax=Caerostris extrusa TaxID=172846 RepID=A0AAV4U4V4_CAEEX|nr:hypothetical protein CEXT_794091 [Caerostris extrusa]
MEERDMKDEMSFLRHLPFKTFHLRHFHFHSIFHLEESELRKIVFLLKLHKEAAFWGILENLEPSAEIRWGNSRKPGNQVSSFCWKHGERVEPKIDNYGIDVAAISSETFLSEKSRQITLTSRRKADFMSAEAAETDYKSSSRETLS